MLLSYVDHVGNLYSKDILDFDFDMFISREGDGFRLNYNKDFLDTNTYETMDEANEAMLDLVDNRNRLESIVLRNM